MSSRIVRKRKLFYLEEPTIYLVIITEWTGGKADTIELFRLTDGDGKLTAVAVPRIPDLRGVHIHFPEEEAKEKK